MGLATGLLAAAWSCRRAEAPTPPSVAEAQGHRTPRAPEPEPSPERTPTPRSSTAPPASASERQDPRATEPTSAPTSNLPVTCTIEMQIFAKEITGHGVSDRDGREAKEAAWAEVCARLEARGDSCDDADALGIVGQRSSSSVRKGEDGKTVSHFEFVVTVGVSRHATGFGDAVDDRAEACRRAKAHACDQLVGGPCPAGARVVTVDGRPPRAADVEPVPVPDEPVRPTI